MLLHTDRRRGCLVAIVPGSLIPEPWKACVDAEDPAYATQRALRDGGSEAYHISITTPAEKAVLESIAPEAIPAQVLVALCGVGCNKDRTCFYAVAVSGAIDAFREQHGLGPKDLHVTLGFKDKDDHTSSKAARTLCVPDFNARQVVAALAGASPARHIAILQDLVGTGTASVPLVIALARAYASKKRFADAAGVLAALPADLDTAADPNPSMFWDVLGLRVAAHGALGTLTAADIDEAIVACSGKMVPPDNPQVDALIRHLNIEAIKRRPEAGPAVLDVRTGTNGPGGPGGSIPNKTAHRVPLPRNFSKVDTHVCGSAALTLDHLPALHALGIQVVVSLVAEAPPTPEFLAAASAIGTRVHFVPVTDRTAPTPDQLQAVLKVLCQKDVKCLVHCVGGLGRTNCVLAAYLMCTDPGLARPSAAIQFLEAQRRVLLTPPQKAMLSSRFAVHEVEAGSGSGAGSGSRPALLPPASMDLAPPVIMLVGLPGSGKSTFCARLAAVAAATPGMEVLVGSQDDLGRDGYADFVASALKSASSSTGSSRPAGVHVVLDRCNLRKDQRAEALALAKRLRLRVACVYFATAPEVCVDRIAGRTGHPVIKSGASGRRIVEDMVKDLCPPSTAEGFEAVHVLSGDGGDVAAAHAPLFAAWFGARMPADYGAPLAKFPRTRHLANLGSATRDDLLFDPKEVAAMLAFPVVVEEKVDGANIGLSLLDGQIVVQNRSHYVNEETGELFRPLKEWLRAHSAELWTIFDTNPRLVLYGEWMHLKHSIHYTRLPDRFLLFDILDGASGKFLDSERVDVLVRDTTLARTRALFKGRTTLDALKHLASTSPSAYYDGPVEGVYVRVEQGGTVTHRGKIVRSDFLEASAEGPAAAAEVVHWTAGRVVKNTLAF